jgi:hypothetical protein
MSEIKIGSLVKHRPGVWGWPGDLGHVETLTEYRAEDGSLIPDGQAFVRIEPGYGYSTSVDDLILVNESEAAGIAAEEYKRCLT